MIKRIEPDVRGKPAPRGVAGAERHNRLGEIAHRDQPMNPRAVMPWRCERYGFPHAESAKGGFDSERWCDEVDGLLQWDRYPPARGLFIPSQCFRCGHWQCRSRHGHVPAKVRNRPGLFPSVESRRHGDVSWVKLHVAEEKILRSRGAHHRKANHCRMVVVLDLRPCGHPRRSTR
jgi:hypothetical protein